MHAGLEYSVCDMPCMIKFYEGEIKPDIVITPNLEEMGKLGMNPKEYHLHKENLELSEQLAKANERVAELESVVAAAIHAFDAYEMDVDTYPTIEHVMLKNNLQSHLNKFAIEKKIEAYKLVLNEYGRGMHPDHQNSLRSLIEQLRKEQE
jgi:tetrahydromethanopterin S-methyltransferase subunit B